jgi:TolA-binding protein
VKHDLTAVLLACAALVLVPASAHAQRQAPATPEQRIDRLERQIQQVQRQVFPKGRPANTAGFADDPAATQSSVVNLDQRLDALEKQVSDLVRQSEENGNRLRTIETGIGQLKTDQDQRIAAIEQRLSEAPPPASTASEVAPVTTAPAKGKPATSKTPPKKTAETEPAPAAGGPAATDTAATATDPGEEAYSQGFRLWQAGQYDQAIEALKAFTAAYPKHRRVSYANNLIGRALLDQGKARDAAAVFLANYRANSRGDRAPDSLYYLGQAEVKLGQPSQACKAYAELDAVYGSKVRADLRKQVDQAKDASQCS